MRGVEEVVGAGTEMRVSGLDLDDRIRFFRCLLSNWRHGLGDCVDRERK